MLASSNVHGLLFFPVAFGLGWAKLSSLAADSSLDYGRYELDDAVTSALVVGGPGEKWLLAANGQTIYIFDIALLASDPVNRQPYVFEAHCFRHLMNRRGSRLRDMLSRLFLRLGH